MVLFDNAWRALSYTKSLDSCGKWERRFFESVYRLTFIIGMSFEDKGILYIIYSSIIKVLLVLLSSLQFLYITEAESLEEKAGVVNTVVIQIITMYKYMEMVKNKSVYKELAAAMSSPRFDTSSPERQATVVYWADKNQGYFRLLLIIGNMTLIVWYLYPLVDDLDYNLCITILLPFSYSDPIIFPFTYLLVLIIFTFMSYFVMINDLLMQAHLIHLSCQFGVLNDCLENIITDVKKGFQGENHEQLLKNNNFRTALKTRLGEIVHQHQALLSHGMALRRVLSRPMLAQLFGSGILICFIGYQAISSGSENVTKCVMSLLYLCYNLFEFFIYCRWGEEITIQSLRVGESAYFCSWENGLLKIPEFGSSISIIIARAWIPLRITAGGVYDLSLQSYSALVKTSYSALTVLLRLNQE